MRRILPFIVAGTASLSAVGQESPKYASTYIQPRNAVLELFTGIYCGNCPDGDTKATSMLNSYPGRSIVIDVHTTAYGKPTSQSHPDYRTPYGDSIAWGAGVYGYPSGMMNRRGFPGAQSKAPYYPQYPPNFALNRMGWKNACKYIVDSSGTSPANIGAATSWNPATRELSIVTEVYYTQQDTVKHRINVAITEDKVMGIQYGSTANPYEHNHMLRDLLTGQWGESIPDNTVGTLYKKTFTTTLDPKINIDNANVVIFVTKADFKWTLTGIQLPAKDGMFVGLKPEEVMNTMGLTVMPNPLASTSFVEFYLNKPSVVTAEVFNVLGERVSREELGTLSAGQQSFVLSPSELGLSKGIYMLKLSDQSREVVTRLIVQ